MSAEDWINVNFKPQQHCEAHLITQHELGLSYSIRDLSVSESQEELLGCRLRNAII